MVSKVLWVVPLPRCTAGPNIVSLVWIGNRLLVWKKGQHLTRAWLTIKRTISWIPNKEAQNPTSRYKIFGESRFLGSCKISYPNKKSCIFPNPAQYFGQFPDPENTLQTLFGCWWLISVSAHKWQVLWCFCFTVHCPSRLLFGAMLFKTYFFKSYLQDFQSFVDKALTLCVICGSQLDSWNLLKPNLDFTSYS